MEKFREMGYKWVGELVFYKKRYSYLDDAFIELCGDCAEHGSVLQLHCHEDIIELAKRFPDIQIVCAHIDINICRQLAELPNTWVDISGKQGGLFIGVLEGAYQAMGADRLLYGTDFTIYDPRAFQARVSAVVRSQEEREKILWKNAVRLLELAGSRPFKYI
jgi:predicted TIM-barrel fold metal-dependent hydrolase